jgi:hypothetical protein
MLTQNSPLTDKITKAQEKPTSSFSLFSAPQETKEKFFTHLKEIAHNCHNNTNRDQALKDLANYRNLTTSRYPSGENKHFKKLAQNNIELILEIGTAYSPDDYQSAGCTIS